VIRAAWATLKLHRVEVIAAATLALISVAWATWVEVRMAGATPPAECMDILLTRGYDALGECTAPVRAWATILVEAGDSFRQYSEYLPFVVGTLVGVPIVAREIDSRTASMAWSMEPSRNRWLLRQLLPVAVIAGLAMTAAAGGAAAIDRHNTIWGGGYRDYTHIGHYGSGLVARWFGAFGIGILAGSLVGRPLPAFLLAIAVSVISVPGLTPVRDAWLDTHPTHALDGEGVPTDWGWRTPDGNAITHAQALASLVPPDIAAQDEGMVQPIHAPEWLHERGYSEVGFGVSVETAFGWAPLEAGAYIGLGLVSIGAAAVLVNRRRPT
jgi:hypothetical protein